MAKRITGKTHVGERRERRPNGDIYIYERITAYNEKTGRTYTVSQKLKGKIKPGTREIIFHPSEEAQGREEHVRRSAQAHRAHGYSGMGRQGLWH